MVLAEKQIFLYVGPHKSGTFYLRDQIFPYVEDIYDVRTRDGYVIDRLLDATAENPLFLDTAALKQELDERLGSVDEAKIVISNPDFFGAYEQMATPSLFSTKQFWDNAHKTRLLSELFPAAKVILTPRRQDTWIESYYRGVLKSALTVSLENFVSPDLDIRAANTALAQRPACDLASLDWSVYIANYFGIFGRENVLVIPNEMLLLDTSEALDRLYDFMGSPPYRPDVFRRVNRGYSSRACGIARALNRYVHGPRNPLGFIPNRPFFGTIMARRSRSVFWRLLAGVSRRLSLNWFLTNVVDAYFRGADELLSEDERAAILERFQNPNRAYAELIGEDLSRYGYY